MYQILRGALAPVLAAITLLVSAVAFAAPGDVAMETPARHAILVDLETHTVLFEKAADEPMPPASMSKLMTAYMLFERLKQGRLSLDDTDRKSTRLNSSH